MLDKQNLPSTGKRHRPFARHQADLFLSLHADAVGEDVFRRSPVTADIILMSLEHGARMHEPLRAHV